jgi:hypothetical protein
MRLLDYSNDIKPSQSNIEMENRIPNSLRAWFVVHFVLDVIIGLPLLLAPGWMLPLFGWQPIDPILSRVVGAALMGIGVESLLGRNAGMEAYRAMLNLKVVWAGSASLGIALGLANGGAYFGWVALVIFLAFLGLWVYYRLKLSRR